MSPTFTINSLTTPSSGDGTSIEALSDSSVIKRLLGRNSVARLHQNIDNRDVLKIADVGNFDVDEICHLLISLYEGAAHIGEQTAEIGVEARRGRAIDDAVVP